MKIALDAMGSDHAPHSEVEGALLAVEKLGAEIILVGRETVIREELRHRGVENHPLIQIVHAEDVIGMDESPALALKQKKNSSISIGSELVAKKLADAFVSAGNTGAVMTSALFTIGRLPAISRPAIAATIPTLKSPCIVLDVGANVDCRPQHLVHFAIMGKVYSQFVLGKANPSIGLLSVGEEREKGNDLTSKTYELLEKMNLNFVGNVEGKDIPRGTVDVVVCDGFIGNVLLKFGEAFAEMIFTSLKSEIFPVIGNPHENLEVMEAFRSFYKKVDYTEYGGAQLLGINGTCIIAHGRSSPKAIANALRAASTFVEHNVSQHIAEEAQLIPDLTV
jgi:glycerol-3-phosphate acyltransferase PlsX